MHLLGEGGEEAAISPATPLVGAFHVFRNRPSFRAARFAAFASWCSVYHFGVLRCALSVRRFLPVARAAGGWLRSALVSLIYTIRHNQARDKNNPCIFLPKKKKQKATEKKTPHFCGASAACCSRRRQAADVRRIEESFTSSKTRWQKPLKRSPAQGWAIFHLNSTNFWFVFEHSNASTPTVIWWNMTTLPGTSAIGVSAGTFTLPFSAPLTLLCSPVSGSV